MNQNRTVFDIDEETDAFYLQKAVEYHEWLIQQEAQPRLTRTPIFRDREDAERRLRADYFDDHSAIRQMAYGSTPDAFDEYLQMSEHTARDALFFFNMCIIELYMSNINCMHWEWKNCPVSWQGQYGRGDKKYPTIMLEAVASQDLWIWHAFYGMAGANNDINVLDDDLLDDLAPVVPYVINGVQYRNGYYLADGIYPEWASFVKSFTVATDPKHTFVNNWQSCGVGCASTGHTSTALSTYCVAAGTLLPLSSTCSWLADVPRFSVTSCSDWTWKKGYLVVGRLS
ncbi:ALP1-like protein, partial [Tanacetum coccineum]